MTNSFFANFSKRFARSLTLLLAVSSIALAANVPVAPFSFGGDDSLKWNRLMKYKLWAEGSLGGNAITFESNVHVTDSVGYVGSPKGGLKFNNDKHELGGPILFRGGFENGNGEDKFLTGPTHFMGKFEIHENGAGNNYFYGKYCLENTISTFYYKALVWDSSKCEQYVPDSIPNVDVDLALPRVVINGHRFDTNLVDIDVNGASGSNFFFDVPRGTGVYDVKASRIKLWNKASFYVRMPPGGRPTRFFFTEMNLDNTASIKVVYAKDTSQWDKNGSYWKTGASDAASNKDYGGDLLIYCESSLAFPAGSDDRTIQGTYITPDKITLEQHTLFAGQMIAKTIRINSDFLSNSFRFVSFNSATIDSKALADGILHEGKTNETLAIKLDQAPSVDVKIKYCFGFEPGADPKNKKTKKTGSIETAAASADLETKNLPLCANNDTATAVFVKDGSALTNPISVTAADDLIAENREYFYLHIWDISGGILDNGKHSGDFKIYIEDNDDIPSGGDTIIAATIGANGDSIGYEDVSFKIESFPAYYKATDGKQTVFTEINPYSIRIESVPANGLLKYNGSEVTKGTIISSGDLAAGKLAYFSAPNEFGEENAKPKFTYTSFEYTVIDEFEEESKSTYTMTIQVLPVNDKPEITNAVSSDSKLHLSVKENSKVDTEFGTITAQDSVDSSRDSKNKLTYKLEDASGKPSSVFQIDPASGKISVQSATLNYEVLKKYDLQVIVTDYGVPDERTHTLSDTILVQVDVTDVNDPPVIGPVDTVVSVRENAPKDSVFIEYKATDEDAGQHVTFRMEATDGSTSFPFEFVALPNQDSAYIKVKSINYEALSTPEYKLRIIGEDGKGGRDTTTLRVIILDANEKPKFDQTSYAFTINEKYKAKDLVGQVNATDPDTKASPKTVLTYSLTSVKDAADGSTVPEKLFAVDSKTGKITIDASVSGILGNAYVNRTFDVTVRATDNGANQNFSLNKKNLYKEVAVTIHVSNDNDPPIIDSATYTFNVDENSPAKTLVGNITVTDEDAGDVLTFSIVPPSGATVPFTYEVVSDREFKLVVAQGANLDYEKDSVYKFKVTVSDGIASATADVTVKINDVNEKPKIVSADLFIDENSAVGKSAGDVKVTDQDLWTKMSYKLLDSTAGATDIFKIASNSTCASGYFCGEITLKKSVLNYEKDSVYYLYVVAMDNGSSKGFKNLADTAVLRIHIKDNNDPPTFSDTAVTVGVDENSPVGTHVGSVAVYASDEDNKYTIQDNLTYSLIPVSKNSATYFTIDATTGEITVAVDSLDHETVAVYKVDVRVTDNRGPQSADTLHLTIKVNDVNEKPTIAKTQTFNIDELEPVGTVVNGAPVKDGDLDTAKAFMVHKFVAIGGDTDAFDIDATTGEIKTKKVLVYSDTTDKEFSLTIQVVDYSDPQNLLVAEDVVRIILNDVNKAPVIEPDTFEIKENAPESTFVGQIRATDDEDPSSKLVFSLVGTSKEFDISTDGIITVKKGANIDYERTKSYTLQIQVEDLKGLTSVGKVRVNVLNVPEAPVIEADTFHVAETAAAKTLVGKALAMDQEDPDSLLTFALIGTSDEFDVSKSGRITVKKSGVLDYESTTSYILEIYVTDTDSMSDTARFLIIVDDVNEAPEIQPVEFHVAENSPAKTKVGTLVAHDAEDPDSVLVFSLAEKSNEFEVSSTGRITVKKGANLDYETKNRYELKVSVTDSKKASSTATVKILIDDIREIPTMDDTTIVIREDAKPDTTFAKLIIDNPEKDKVKIKLITKTKVFKISDDGKVTLIDTLDYESKKKYELVVTVEGEDGSIDTAHVTIKVQNVVEIPEVKITRATDEDSLWLEPDTIFTNSKRIDFEWTVDKKLQPDTTVKFPKDSTYIVKVCYDDPTKDKPGCDSVVVIVDNSIPRVRISKTAEDTAEISSVTIVEQVDENDTNFYVNHELNEVRIHITDAATETDSTFNTNLRLDSLLNIKSSLSDIKKVAKKKNITMDDAESAEKTKTLVNNKTYVVSFEKEVNGKTVKVSYNTDKNGKVIKNDDGDVEMTVEYQTVVGNKDVTISYKVNGSTGELIKNDNGGSFEYAYEFDDSFGGHVGVRYSVDDNGEIVKNDEGNYGYQVSYTYKNKFGNEATKNIFIVVDKVVPVVKITSPKDKSIVRTNGIAVEWTVDGVVQDTLGIQGLSAGLNAIVRTYRDKAGNEASDTIFVVMKNPKSIKVHVVKPVTTIDADSVEKYYGDNPPEEGQSFAVSMYNPKEDKESKTLVGGSFGKKKGDGEEPYSGVNGSHLGPTLVFDAVAPRCGDNAASGLCTLDDLVERDGLISLDAGGGRDRRKVTVDEYVNNYCSEEFRKEYKGDSEKANLFKMSLHVNVWIYSNLGSFLNEYRFVQDLNDPEFVNDVGEVRMFFELTPDMNGDVRTAEGRLLGTGAYIFKTEVKSVAQLRCKLPDEEIGHKRYATDELLKSFGYKRPKTK